MQSVMTLEVVKKKYPRITTELCREVTFITSQELEDKYPDLTPKERENAIVKEHKTVFIMQIGDKRVPASPMTAVLRIMMTGS